MALVEWKQQFSYFLDSFKQSTSKDLMGLDFGPGSLKLLRIKKASSQYEVENFTLISIPADVYVKGVIKDSAAMVYLLKEAFKSSKSTTRNVAFAIPRFSTLIKTITIDKRLKAEDIESRAWIEANRLFPDLVGDIYLDFIITGPSPTDKSQLELLFVACRKDQIKPYLDIIREAGLIAKIVDLNSYALERAISCAIPQDAKLETIGLLNINLNLSTFIVIQNKNLIHAQDQSYDGNRLLHQTQEYLKNSEKKPTQNYSELLDDPQYYAILKERLISHLRHTLHSFHSSRPHVQIQQILLSGDCATVPAMNLFIEKEMQMQSVIANPFLNMKLAPIINQDELQQYAPTLMLCCGLALSNVKANET